MKIPIAKPYFDEKETEAVKKVIQSGWIIQGKRTEEFENRVASYTKSKYAIATTNCTSALYLSLLAAGVKKGDEVICPSFTFIATPNSIEHTGAKPVFCDIDEKTCNIDPDLIEEIITDKTRAIMPVDQLGLPYPHEKVARIAEKYNLRIIEDAAPALGAEYDGKKIGSLSDLTCFSMHPRKVITTGEGGVITTDDEAFNGKLRMLRSHGTETTPLERQKRNILADDYVDFGFNFRMTDLQAAIGIEQLKKLHEILRKRAAIAKVYNDAFGQIESIGTPYVPEYATHTYQTYSMRIIDKPRDRIMEYLIRKGIAVRPGVEMCHTATCYVRKYGPVSLPRTEHAHRTTILIPIYPSMTGEEQEYVIKHVREAMNKC
jgi:perosamine synthetase